VKLRSAALQVAARELLGVRLLEADADEIAGHADVDRVIGMLRERLMTRRGPQALAGDVEFQNRLAVVEIMMEVVNPSAASDGTINKVVLEAIAARLAQADAKKRTTMDELTLEKLLDTLATASRAFRQFSRNARRIFQEHRQKLVLGLSNDDDRTAAIRELTALHSRFLSRALIMARLDPSRP